MPSKSLRRWIRSGDKRVADRLIRRQRLAAPRTRSEKMQAFVGLSEFWTTAANPLKNA
jgi:hypothetical protein